SARVEWSHSAAVTPQRNCPDVLPRAAPGGPPPRRIIDSLHIADVKVTPTGVRLDMAFTVEETTLEEQALSPGPEPTLRPDEIEAWNVGWNPWERFVPCA